MSEYLKQVNSLPFYLIVGGVLLFILIMCVVFLVKSYRAGIAIGMDKKVMRRAIMSSATFSRPSGSKYPSWCDCFKWKPWRTFILAETFRGGCSAV